MPPLAFLFRHSVVLDAVLAEGVDWASTITSDSAAMAVQVVTEVEKLVELVAMLVVLVVAVHVLVVLLVAVLQVLVAVRLLLVDVSLTLAKPTVSTGSGKMCSRGGDDGRDCRGGRGDAETKLGSGRERPCMSSFTSFTRTVFLYHLPCMPYTISW